MLTSPKAVARLAGVLYIIGSLGFVAGIVLRSTLSQAGDATTTAESLRASEALVGGVIAIGLVSSAAWVFAVIALHRLLTRVERLVAASMVLLVVLAVALQCVGLVALHAALTIATGTTDAGGVAPQATAASVVLATELQRSASLLAEFFWGLWLLPLGYLVMRSRSFPAALGALLILGGFSLLANLGLAVLTGRGLPILLVLDVGELLFVVWLLARGVTVNATVAARGGTARGVRANAPWRMTEARR